MHNRDKVVMFGVGIAWIIAGTIIQFGPGGALMAAGICLVLFTTKIVSI